MKPALYSLCKATWKHEIIPLSWQKSTLVQIFKGSGSRNDLKNYRFIHMKNEFQKFFGHLVLSASKEKLLTNMSKFQIGTKPGHRSQEHLFTIKSTIALYDKYKKPLFLTTYDVAKFFDRENLQDCMNELYKCGVRGKLYRLMYNFFH